MDRQQGTCCTSCGSNLRSIALAKAIMNECGTGGTLHDFVAGQAASALHLLEINEAGTLSPTLRRLPGHVFGAYPELDMQAMHYPDGSFDLIVHSDTLEHVPDPMLALRECARVLKPDGALCFTVPVIPGRMSVPRADLRPIHHGDPAHPTDDLLVHTDYGADVWHQLHQAGFAAVTLLRFADGLAITASHHARRPRVAGQDRTTALKARLNAMSPGKSWRISASLRRATRLLRGGGAVVASQPISHTKAWQQPRGPELAVGLGSLAAWRAWSAEHSAEISVAASQGIVEQVLRDGVEIPLFGAVPANEVAMNGSDPRESLISRGINSRLRAVLQVMSWQEQAHDVWNCRIHLHEALTPFAMLMRGRYARLVASKYAPDEAAGKALWPVPAVDVTQSPFPDASFDFVVTNEVLEHVADLPAALRDAARILVPGGQLVGTVPFNYGAEHTAIRARLTDAGIEHLHPPEYHGNPLDPEGGSLVFQIPGWDILSTCREAGFTEAQMVFLSSGRYGVAGAEIAGTFVLVAKR